MDAGVIAAIITAGIALIGSIISIVVSSQKADKDLYAKSISANRYEWMQNLRQNITDLVTYCKTAKTELDTDKEGKNFTYYRTMILLKLNPRAKEGGAQRDFRNLLLATDFIQLKEKTEKILEYGSKLFKAEWERYKAEIGETPIKKRRISRTAEKIENMNQKEFAIMNKKDNIIVLIIFIVLLFISIGISALAQTLGWHDDSLFIWMMWLSVSIICFPSGLGIYAIIRICKKNKRKENELENKQEAKGE